MEELAKEFKRLTQGEPTIVLGVVKSVDVDKNTIEAEIDGLLYTDIRLNATAVSSDQKVILIPEVKSTVILARLEHSNEDFKFLGTDKVKQALIQIENTKIEIDKQGVKIERNGQDFKVVMDSFMDSIINMVVPSAVGPATLSPVNQAQIQQQKASLGQIFK